MRRFAYGRRAANHSRRLLRSALVMAAALDPLGPPPAASNNYMAAVKAPWGMYGNDTLSDCVPADTAHTLMLRTANMGQIVVPTQAQVVDLYSAVGGYNPYIPQTDDGCSEDDMCQYLVATGFLGHKADATGAVEPSNLAHLQWCIQLFGHCRIGLNLPGYAEEQFYNGAPWDVSSTGDQSTMGHDVPLVDYRNGTFTCISWGKEQVVTPAFVIKYAEEAHAELFFDWCQAQGTADLTDLAGKLKEVTA